MNEAVVSSRLLLHSPPLSGSRAALHNGHGSEPRHRWWFVCRVDGYRLSRRAVYKSERK
jgi:hypothetical protein